jgi:hypothetical protein
MTDQNPGFTNDAAARFLEVAENTLCPQHIGGAVSPPPPPPPQEPAVPPFFPWPRCQVRCKVLRFLVLDRFEIFGEGLVGEVVEFFALRLRTEEVAD